MGRNQGKNEKIYRGEHLTYILAENKKGITIEFTKNAKVYEVRVEQKVLGHVSLTDYYKLGDSLTYNEFKELE